MVPAACIFSAGGPQASVEAWPSLRPPSREGEPTAKLGRLVRRETANARRTGNDGCRDPAGFNHGRHDPTGVSK
ncbi:hypothetical protein BRAS3843_2470032 [Bradyrhizobium sp. STM 3843]|nr:hypothetical protein BRAS3843_2470032 [Bradyrhizobium sp. STM 3843]